MYKGQSITVIIPCLNEEEGIERVLGAMPEFVDEIIVVDNGSTDRTAEIAASLGAKVLHQELRGYGRGGRRGFSSKASEIRSNGRDMEGKSLNGSIAPRLIIRRKNTKIKTYKQVKVGK